MCIRDRYDIHKVALILPQTGGGCRASNYIHLLRKALDKNGYGFIPVISVSYTHLDVYKRQAYLWISSSPPALPVRRAQRARLVKRAIPVLHQPLK